MLPSNTLFLSLSVTATALAAPSCPKVGVNLLANPGFEASKKSILPWKAFTKAFAGPDGTYSVASGGRNSPNAFALTTPVQLLQNVTGLCGDREYLASYYRRVTDAQPDGLTYFVLYSSASEATHSFTSQGITKFSKFVDYLYVRSAPKNVAYSISVGNPEDRPNTAAAIDDTAFYAIDPPVLKEGATELLKNPGFETGKLNPWTNGFATISKATITKPGLNGSKYAVVAGNGAVFSQNVTLTVGSHYLVTAEYDAPAPVNASLPYYVGIITDTGFQQATFAGDPQIGSFYGYNKVDKAGPGKYSRRLVAHGKNVKLGVAVFYDNTEQPAVKFDNFSLKEIVAPTFA